MKLPAAPLTHPNDAEILRLAVPAFGALIAEPLFLLADSAIVGHLGTEQLAGLGVAATIIATAVSLCVFLAYGTTSIVARMLGAGDMAGALRRGIHGLWLAVSIGLLLAVTGLLTAPTAVGLFGPSAEAAGHAVTYMRISMVGIPAMLIILAMTGVLRGLQDTRTPLYVAAGANLANIGLSAGLVYGAGLGMAGSALGTIIAQWSAAALYMIVVVRAARRLDVRLTPDPAGMRAGLVASAPLLLRNLALRGVLTSPRPSPPVRAPNRSLPTRLPSRSGPRWHLRWTPLLSPARRWSAVTSAPPMSGARAWPPIAWSNSPSAPV